MSCHFHLLRRQRAAEAAHMAAVGPQNAEKAEGNTSVPESKTAPQKASKARRKGDA